MPSTIATTELASELRVSLMRLARRLRAERADKGLTLTQLSVLGTLDRHGAMTLGELAAHEKVQPPSMTKILAALEAHGYVTRTPDPVDRRQVVVVANDAGRELLADDRRRKDRWVSQRLAGLAPSERAALAAALPILEKLSRS
jgi:DNA-binding MarR family transcriptional regulator